MEPGGENKLGNQPEENSTTNNEQANNLDDNLDDGAAPSADSLHAASFDDADVKNDTETAHDEVAHDNAAHDETAHAETEADQIDALADELVSTLAVNDESKKASDDADKIEPESSAEETPKEPVEETPKEPVEEAPEEPIEETPQETIEPKEPAEETLVAGAIAVEVAEAETEKPEQTNIEVEEAPKAEAIVVETAEDKPEKPAEEAPKAEPETTAAQPETTTDSTAETLVAESIVNQPPKPPKRKSPVVTFLMVLMIILLLGAVAFAFFVVLGMPKLSNKTLDETPTPTASESAEESLTCTYVASINSKSNATTGVATDSGLKAQHNQTIMNFVGGELTEASLKTVYTYSKASDATSKVKDLEDTYNRTYTAVGLKSDPFTSKFTAEKEVATQIFYATIDQLNSETATLINFPVTGKNNPKTTSADLEEYYTENGYTCNIDRKHQNISEKE